MRAGSHLLMHSNDPFGRSSLPQKHLGRTGRVALLLETAEALVAGDPVPPAAAWFLGKALLAWLSDAGDLEHHLGVKAPAGSHHTPALLARRLIVTGVEADHVPAEIRRFEASSGGAQPDDVPATLMA